MMILKWRTYRCCPLVERGCPSFGESGPEPPDWLLRPPPTHWRTTPEERHAPSSSSLTFTLKSPFKNLLSCRAWRHVQLNKLQVVSVTVQTDWTRSRVSRTWDVLFETHGVSPQEDLQRVGGVLQLELHQQAELQQLNAESCRPEEPETFTVWFISEENKPARSDLRSVEEGGQGAFHKTQKLI